MALNEKEIELLIEKLRNRYFEYAKKFNPKWFDINSFEDRFLMARQNRMNLEAFILAEIANFEKIKEKYDRKKKEKDKSFSIEVDKIIEENNARISKYPKIEFHPLAGFEISHFYGAISDFALYYYPVLWIMINDKDIKDILIKLESELNHLAMPRGKTPSKRIGDHSLILSRSGVRELDIEKDKNDYLKESAFILHTIIDLCDGLMERRDEEWEVPLSLAKLYIEDNRKKKAASLFSGLTGYGAILKIREYCSNMIEDFRLKAFRKK